jgi:hypothetical protein
LVGAGHAFRAFALSVDLPLEPDQRRIEGFEQLGDLQVPG